MTNVTPFTTSYTYNVLLKRLWQAWTDKNDAAWLGPKGCTTEYINFDFRAGGEAFYRMAYMGAIMYGKWSYKQVEAPNRFTAVVSFVDETGKNIIPHPGAPTWPLKMETEVLFKEKGKQSEVTVKWWPSADTSEIEKKTFEEGREGMKEGWAGSFERLEQHLASSKAAA